jgi:hypothetical protein
MKIRPVRAQLLHAEEGMDKTKLSMFPQFCEGV